VKKLLVFYGTPRFITAFMTALQILKTNYFSTQFPCFSKHCAYSSMRFLHSLEYLFFGCMKNQSCTASFTSPPTANLNF
jgi:hypothetical protein